MITLFNIINHRSAVKQSWLIDINQPKNKQNKDGTKSQITAGRCLRFRPEANDAINNTQIRQENVQNYDRLFIELVEFIIYLLILGWCETFPQRVQITQ